VLVKKTLGGETFDLQVVEFGVKAVRIKPDQE